MHVAGRAAEIGLATVAEVQNAKSVPAAVDAIHTIEGTGQSIALSGVWRICPEHGGDNSHIQQSSAGTPYEGPTPTNPPHVFKVHPVLNLGGQDLTGTLRPIDGSEEKEAGDAFSRYERSAFEIMPSEDRGRLRMRMVGYNYVKFMLKLRKRFHREQDGEFVSAAIFSAKKTSRNSCSMIVALASSLVLRRTRSKNP